MKKTNGFTLIELMIILAVVAIVAGFGVPQISLMLQNNRLVSQINYLSGNLQYARSEAIRRVSQVKIQSSDGSTDWKNGWTVYIDQNDDGVIDAGEELRVTDALSDANITVTGPAGDVIFSGDGSSNASHNFTVTDGTKTYTASVSLIGTVKIN